MKRLLFMALLAAGCGGDESGDVCAIPGGGPGFAPDGTMCEKLSSYHLFDDIAAQTPTAGLFPYQLNTALFSDYTRKDRFLYIPDGETFAWADVEAFDLPVGAVIVKTFSYPADLREPDGPRDLLETRLLLRGEEGWDAASYVYDETDDEAYLAIAGDTVHAEWLDVEGARRENEYVVPNKNQCKNCHDEHEGGVVPLGPKARHINFEGQLEALIDAGVLTDAPADPATWPRTPVFDDPSTGDLDARARAWLDVNCAHCHNPTGAARTSGLDLRMSQTEPAEYGVCKPPVAAGGGSGGRSYAIVPGDPDMSILVYRIESTEADIKMPELGRNLVHEEGVALIREWIAAMPGTCAPQAAAARSPQ
jgi:uncharacterized repeat protein (TIGR03806 family)